MKEYLFETDGISVYVEDGILYEVTDSQVFDFKDTGKNRVDIINDAKATIKAWED